MSRTRHHRNQRNRHCGEDLWSRRPNSGSSYNKASREETKRRERQRDKRLEHDALMGEDVRGQFRGE